MTSLKIQIDAPPPDEADEDDSLYGRVVQRLKTVMDPEIPVNIYDLGLIYECVVDEAGKFAKILMTVTAPNCPVAGEFPNMVKTAVLKVEGIETCEVTLTFQPPWTKDKLTADGRAEMEVLGIL